MEGVKESEREREREREGGEGGFVERASQKRRPAG